MEKSTRHRIREYLLQYQVATAAELSHGLGMTKANIQYHLQSMLDDNIVEITRQGQGKQKGPGRPTHAYKLTYTCQPDNLDHLLISLFRHRLDLIKNKQEMKQFLEELAANMFPPEPNHYSQPISKRINSAIEVLNEHSYRAHWEAHRDGPRIIVRNCPYIGIRKSVPETCNLDEIILTNLLHQDITHLTHIDPTEPGSTFCSFAIQEGIFS